MIAQSCFGIIPTKLWDYLYRLSPWSINIITTFINFLSILAYLIADLTTCQPNFKIQFRYFTNINS